MHMYITKHHCLKVNLSLDTRGGIVSLVLTAMIGTFAFQTLSLVGYFSWWV